MQKQVYLLINAKYQGLGNTSSIIRSWSCIKPIYISALLFRINPFYHTDTALHTAPLAILLHGLLTFCFVNEVNDG